MATLEELEAQKKENSAKWHTATTQAEKDALHQANVNIMGQIDAMTGSKSTYDGATGVWTTTPESRAAASSYDQSESIKKNYAAQLEAGLASLSEQRDRGLAEYNAEAAKLPEQYQAARNSTAAQNAIAKKNFDEQAASAGLNSGTSGQAALARSAVYQANLSGLDRSQAADLAEIERAKANLRAQYNTQFAKLKADSDAALNDALYQEAVRVQNLQREDEQRAEERERYAKEYQDTLRAQSAGVLAQGGDYSAYGELYGWTPEQLQSMTDRYKKELQSNEQKESMDLADWYAQYGDLSKARELGVDPEYRAQRTSTGGNSGGSDGKKSLTDEEIFKMAKDSGGDPKGYLARNYATLGIPYSQIGYFQALYDTWATEKKEREARMANTAATLRKQLAANIPTEKKLDAIDGALSTGSITEAAAQELLRFIGYDDKRLAEYGY